MKHCYPNGYAIGLEENDKYCIVGWSLEYTKAIRLLWEGAWLPLEDTPPFSEYPPYAVIFEVKNNTFNDNKIYLRFKYDKEKKGYRPIEPVEWE